ncbi:MULTISPECIES: ABC-three component system middle component 7 [Bacteria]|uniref:ABC-three component system middle component 7 n=1 Tax=Bacteria TaxID=2 RepID=UPI0034A04E14
MITPNKFIPLSDSALGKIEITYNQIDGKKSAGEIYDINKSKYESLDQFIYSIEILYLMDKIEMNELSGVLSKC